jgi:cell division protein FtsL
VDTKKIVNIQLRRRIVLNKLTSATLVAALLVVLCGTSAFANNSSNDDVRTNTTNIPSEAPVTKEVKPNEQLKNRIVKLVSDTKAGKVAMAPKSQIQPAKSNSWSKGTKIAVGVAIAAAVIVTILIVSPAFNDGQ